MSRVRVGRLGGIKLPHNFNESLAKSQAMEDAPWWPKVYAQAFPSLLSFHSVRNDGWAQRGGIDRVIVLKSGKTLTVDEKVRYKEYDDILLERWSDERKEIPGWIQKDLACDYIAYAFVQSQRCYLLPFQQLRRAWLRYGRGWIERYPRIPADNGTYTTVSVAVPTAVVMDAIADAMKVVWVSAANDQSHEEWLADYDDIS